MGVHKDMNVSHMKNIIVLKDLPSNLVDEAIVILKNGSKIKKKDTVQNVKYKNDFMDNGNYETAIKEAEFLVADYIESLEKPKETNCNIRKMKIQYNKLKFCSILLGLTTIIGIIISIFK